MFEEVVADVAVWIITFGFGSIFSWLVFLTIRHYKYAKPAYEALAGTPLDDGHLSETGDRFQEMETAHEDMRERVNRIEGKVDKVDQKTERNYSMLKKIAQAADVDTIFFRGGSGDRKRTSDDD